MKPKVFLNDPANAVDEFISGLLLQYPTRFRKLTNHRVILHPSFAADNNGDIDHHQHPNLHQVSILSGGGSGHEPSHAGYISSTMLSGAILGGIFASPPVSSILAAIHAVTLKGGKGCLLIVKNYTGDRLNFGIARELAIEKYGLQVDMCIVADDTAVPRSKGITGARGVAGTVLVHKCAGGAAYQGKDLHEVTRIANSVAKQVKSLGVALDAVTIPGATTMNDRIPPTMMEVGLGIHGEAGMRQCNVMTCDEIATTMCMSIRDYGREVEDEDIEVIVPLYEPGCELLVMVNNLGGTSNFEMSLLTRSVVKHLEGSDNAKVARVLVGSYMTSFDMHGASVTIMPLTGWGDAIDVLSYIDSDTDALAWTKVDVWTTLNTVRPSDIEIDEVVMHEASALSSPLSSVLIDDFANVARATLTRCCLALIAAEPILTKYDTIVGDGDCGMTMERGSREILKRLDNAGLRLHHPSFLFADLADAISSSMGGTSGILLELFFRKAGTYLQTRDITSVTMAESFREGVSAISFYGGAKRGSRTMLDALLPASVAILPSLATLADVQGAADAARMGADETSNMEIAEAGRSNYLSDEVLMGTPDPGAIAVAIVFEAMVDNGNQELSETLLNRPGIAEMNESGK
jgi:dihydroxyacetone kinase